MSTPRYVTRIARLPAVFERLAREPEGVPLARLAADLAVPVAELREDLLAFYAADAAEVDWLMGLGRPEVLEFLGPDGSEEDPNSAEVVRIVAERPDLGVEYVDAGELGLVYTAALALLEVEPDNTDLAEAVDVLAETMFGESAGESVDAPGVTGPGPGGVHGGAALLARMREAVEQRRAVRIVYSRSWAHGVTERVVHPYRLVQTRRGWEVDAGPPDDLGRLRTYLVSNLREVEPVAGEAGEAAWPHDLERLLDEQRATTRVRLLLPQSARWAADFYAERVEFVEDDEESVVVDVDLLPPVERRVGMLLLAAGPEAMVLEPAALHAADVVLAAELFWHHSS